MCWMGYTRKLVRVQSYNINKLFNWNGSGFDHYVLYFFLLLFFQSWPSFNFKNQYVNRTSFIHITIYMIKLTKTTWCRRLLLWKIEYSGFDMIVIMFSEFVTLFFFNWIYEHKRKLIKTKKKRSKLKGKPREIKRVEIK